MLPSPRSRGLGPRSHIFSRPSLGSLTLRPGDSLTIPKMASSVGFIRFVSSTDATQATKVLTLPPVGLTPTEHASLSWTHCFPNIPTTMGITTQACTPQIERRRFALSTTSTTQSAERESVVSIANRLRDQWTAAVARRRGLMQGTNQSSALTRGWHNRPCVGGAG